MTMEDKVTVSPKRKSSGWGGQLVQLAGIVAAVFIATATPGVDGQGNPTLVLAGSKLASLVAPENASAVPALATDLSVQLAPSPARESLLAPVLAR